MNPASGRRVQRQAGLVLGVVELGGQPVDRPPSAPAAGRAGTGAGSSPWPRDS